MFELVVGQPPFSGIMAKKGDIIQQMVDTIGELPAEWQRRRELMPKQGMYRSYTQTTVLTLPEPVDETDYNLEQLLQELCFDHDKTADFSQQDIRRFTKLIGKLLRYHPSARSTAVEILSDGWFCNV
jgi:serine/threonine-protein kinase SRPK3